MKIDISVISLILSSITALAAVIGPVISSIINVRSNERTKRFELYSPQVFAAVRRFSDAYARIPRKRNFDSANEYGRIALNQEFIDSLKEFTAAAYEVASFIPNNQIHDRITVLLTDLKDAKWATEEHDRKFQELSASIAKELAAKFSPKKERITRKSERNTRK